MNAATAFQRRLVVLLDGTWNHPDQKDRGKTKPSNVTKLARAVKPVASDGRSQIAYYDDGVETSWGLDKWVGGGLGIGLAKNIREAYRFLVYNYNPGDEIYLFGFSRGAWTARSLAGFIDRFGILVKSDAFYLQAAFQLYERDGLANCALHWIVGCAREAGLDVDTAFLKPYRPFWGDELRQSYRGLCRLLGPARRKIGTNGTETVDRSVYLRYLNPDDVLRKRSQPEYRPANVESYLHAHGLTVVGEAQRLEGMP